MAMAMMPEKKKKKASTASPMSKPETVTSNIELQSLKKQPDKPNPPKASTSSVRDTNQALAKVRAQCEKEALENATKTASRQAPEIKADTKVSLESITNDHTAPRKFKDKVQKTDRVINTYLDKIKQADGKQLSKEETVVFLDDTIECIDEIRSTAMYARDELTGGSGDDGDGGGSPSNQEKWYHRFLQWLQKYVDKIWNTVKELKPLSRVASLWERFREWLRSKFSAKKSTPGDGAMKQPTQV